MKFILVNLFLIILLSCEKNPASDDSSDTGGGDTSTPDLEVDYLVCENCIWLQNDCSGNWILGYHSDSAIGGFQFTVDGATILSTSGGDSELNGFSITSSSSNLLGFSFGGNSIPEGSGELLIINLEGYPTGLSGIVFSAPNAESIGILFYGIVDCYDLSLQNTGVSQLTIFKDSITSLEIGDKIGIFDSDAILNYGDCSTERGALLVGVGIWDGEQLNIVSIGSVDLCNIGGVQLSGYVEGHSLVVRVYRPSNGIVYSTELSWETGSGLFGENLHVIDSINLINSSLSKRLF